MNFESFLRANGLLPRDVVADGKWHRCPTTDHPRKRNGAFKFLGDVGFAQNHATQTEVQVWRPDADYRPAPIDRDAIRKRESQARKELVRATQTARAFYAACRPLLDGHPYLEAHGLSMEGCFGLKIDHPGWMVVPMYRDRNLMSVQRIAPDGEKKFWTGASTGGTVYIVERPGAQVTVICEGLATGLAIFAAVPMTRIVVAFTAGNLAKVKKPSGLTVIAADNDHLTAVRLGHNPGLKAAQEAATALGCGVAVPECRGSDWADYRQERIAALQQARPKERLGAIRRAVDAEITAQVMRQAKYLGLT